MNCGRRTKIVATLGSATDKADVLRSLIQSGVDVVRLNFSHGSPEDHLWRARQVCRFANECNRSVALLADLQGPRIRIARFKDNQVRLEAGSPFALDAGLDSDAGTGREVGVDYKALPQDCRPGDLLLLDDGRIQLRVYSIKDQRIESQVVVGGWGKGDYLFERIRRGAAADVAN